MSIGHAAHITAASPGGPRYDPSLSQADRKAATNGIWLCRNCGTKVDCDPEGFLVALLREWKRLAEDHARDNIGRTRSPQCSLGDPPNFAAVLPHGSLEAGPGAGPVDADLDEARQELEAHRPEVARRFVDRLLARHAGILTQRHRWRAKTILAMSLLADGDSVRSGVLLLEALAHQPGELKARVNAVTAHELLRDLGAARSLAADLRREYTDSAAVAAAWVRTSPAEVTAEALEFAAAKHPDDADVALALGSCMALRRDGVRAERYARRTTELEPDGPQGWLCLAQAFHQRGLDEPHAVRARGLLAEADAYYTQALDLATRQRLLFVQHACYVGRAVARGQAGRNADADADFRLALAGGTDRGVAAGRYAVFLFLQKRFAEAAGVAEAVPPGGEDLRDLLAAAIFERNGPGDRERAIKLWREVLTDGSPGPREGAVWNVVHGLCLTGRPSEAWAWLAALPQVSLAAAVRLTAEARVLEAEGDTQAAAARGREAAAAADGLSVIERLNLAHLLAGLGLFDEVVTVLLPVHARRLGTLDLTRMLIGCAVRAGRHRVALDLLRQAREDGYADGQQRRDEIDLLSRYDPRAAGGLALDYLIDNPDDRQVRLRLSLFGHWCEVPEWVTTGPEDLPPPGDCDPATTGRAVIQLLARRGRNRDALQFAYGLLRTHIDDPAAHLAYVGLFLLGDVSACQVDSPGVVGPDVAVQVRDVDSGASWWHVVEEDEPREALGERPPSDPRVAPMLGRRVGDRFVVAAGVRDRVGEVVDVQSKFVHRFVLSRDNYQIRFPERQDFQAVSAIRRRPDGREEVDPTPLFATLDQARERQGALLRHYEAGEKSAYTLASNLSRDMFTTMEALSDYPGPVHCASGDIAEWGRAVAHARGAATLVLDLTALFALWRLDLCESLRQAIDKPFLVTRGTWDVLRALVDEENSERPGPRVSALGGGRYEWVEPDLSNEQQRHDSLVRLLKWVRAKCDVVGCLEMADMAPAIRDALVALFGRGGAESLSVAGRPGHVLWTDDMPLAACLPEASTAGRRTWTQAVVRAAVDAGGLPEIAFVNASARLLGWQYTSTVYDLDALVRSGELAEWAPERRPFRQALEALGNEAVSAENRVILAGHFVLRTFGVLSSGLTRQGVMRAVFKGLASHSAVTHLGTLFPDWLGPLGPRHPYAVEVRQNIRDWKRTSLWVR